MIIIFNYTKDVLEVEPGLTTTSPIDGNIVTVFGVQPPEVVSLEQLCPPIVECKKCPDVTYVTQNCTGTGFLFDLIYRWEIKPLGRKDYKKLPKRNQGSIFKRPSVAIMFNLFCLNIAVENIPFFLITTTVYQHKKVAFLIDCVLEAIGKPVYHGYIDQDYGSWMMDSNPANDRVGNKYWITNETNPTMLYEYGSKGNLTQ